MRAPRILVVDDEADLRELLEITLIKMGLDVDCADTLASARAHLARTQYALILTDMRLPDGIGLELVREIATGLHAPPVAVLTAFGSAENAVEALKAGAFDYLSKPVVLEQLRKMVYAALRLQAQSVVDGSSDKPGQPFPFQLLGESPAIQQVRQQIQRLALSMAPVAIRGESGSGKELAARDLHALSPRAGQPFIAVNCGAIPESLMEAEFFGYRKGAFTGAHEEREGFFQAANGGTLFLDEVADLPLAMQVKLLRAIQERRVRKLGATNEETVDVRLVSATHQDLAACMAQGRFRQDLYYRLNVIELTLPPLRQRKEDLGLLVAAIFKRLKPAASLSLTPAALATLATHAFPGNVRELENILERALAFATQAEIDVEDLGLSAVPSLSPPAEQEMMPGFATTPASAYQVDGSSAMRTAPPAEATPLPASLPAHLDAVERRIICQALDRTRFNRTQAAELLGISFRQLRYRMQRLKIYEPD